MSALLDKKNHLQTATRPKLNANSHDLLKAKRMPHRGEEVDDDVADTHNL